METIFWRREKETNKEYTIDEEWLILKYGKKTVSEMKKNCNTYYCLSPFADYKAMEAKTQMELEQSEAADKQAHADHLRETMEDR